MPRKITRRPVPAGSSRVRVTGCLTLPRFIVIRTGDPTQAAPHPDAFCEKSSLSELFEWAEKPSVQWGLLHGLVTS